MSFLSPSSFLDVSEKKRECVSAAAVGFHREATARLECGQDVARLVDGFRIEGVVVPAPFPTTRDDAGIDQRLQMPRQPRLCHLEICSQLTHTALAGEQLIHHVDPDWIGQRVKQVCGAVGVESGCGGHAQDYNKNS